MIRISTGKYKGRFIKTPPSKNTRPTMDKVREAIFSAIKGKSRDSVCLDLFAGSGSMGIEALSRGARKCYFVDKDRIAIKTIRENLMALEDDKELYSINPVDYRLFLKKNRDMKFDLVFLDPPYRYEINENIIKYMLEFDMLAPDAVVVSEQDRKNVPIEGLSMKEYKYGQKNVAVYRKEEI